MEDLGRTFNSRFQTLILTQGDSSRDEAYWQKKKKKNLQFDFVLRQPSNITFLDTELLNIAIFLNPSDTVSFSMTIISGSNICWILWTLNCNVCNDWNHIRQSFSVFYSVRIYILNNIFDSTNSHQAIAVVWNSWNVFFMS